MTANRWKRYSTLIAKFRCMKKKQLTFSVWFLVIYLFISMLLIQLELVPGVWLIGLLDILYILAVTTRRSKVTRLQMAFIFLVFFTSSRGHSWPHITTEVIFCILAIVDIMVIRKDLRPHPLDVPPPKGWLRSFE